MHVPDHIYIGDDGERNKKPDIDSDILTVPERITLAGSGTHLGSKVNFSKDLLRGQIDAINVKDDNSVPLTITASEMSFQAAFVDPKDSINHSSAAIEENPIKELKIMRRRLGNISTRLIEIEEEYARRHKREIILWAVLAGALVAFAFFNRKRY